MERKKRILFHSNNSKAFTGFGKNARNILKSLFATNKYEILELSNGISFGHPILEKMPWKCVGSVPNNPARLQELNRDPNLQRKAGYGHELIDQVVQDFKPDIYVGVEDIWAFEGFWDKKWWNKVNSIIWTTLDSLPILPIAEENASKIKNYFVWASFAEKALRKHGHDHVKTLRGSLDCDNFFPIAKEYKKELRQRNGISPSDFIIGFVFRNQLRKSVPNLLDGFKLFQKRHPESNAKLLLHTHWSEGWDIPRLINEKQLNPADILTTYFCSNCGQYEIKPFSGQSQDCRFCGKEKSQNTTNVNAGVDEEQLNEIYNMMDVYCHPFTSGGQEIPVQEAKLTQLITLVTNYSCGEDSCTPQSGGLPLDWAEYREPGTQFIKASTSANSICKQLIKVFKMKPAKREEIGKKARQFVIDNFGIEVISGRLQEMFDGMDVCDWDFDFSEKPRNPDYIPNDQLPNEEWLTDIYKNILNMDVNPKTDQGLQYWMNEFAKGAKREAVLNYFKQVAAEENQKSKRVDFEDLLDNTENKRALLVLKESAGDVFNATSLFKSFKESHPDHDLYFACDPQFIPILNGNPHVHKCLAYHDAMENELAMIGHGANKGYFDFYCNLGLATQRQLNYLGNDNKVLDIYY
tara:strand:- start:11926 stop:13830 length:1905 start_codon:yes stop_codon:yes gene_type:complete